MNIFAPYEDDYGMFHLIKKPVHQRPDLCAFLMLDRYLPGTWDMISAAEHDEIFLDVRVDALRGVDASVLRDLHRCGVRHDTSIDALCMFVGGRAALYDSDSTPSIV